MSFSLQRFVRSLHQGIQIPQRLVCCPRRYFSQSTSTGSKLDLPPEADWRKHFQIKFAKVTHRVSIRNAETAAKLADAFVPDGSKGKVIVEAFPGPGQLSRALLKLPKERIRKLIILEDWNPYLEYLRPLQELDPRVVVIEMDGYSWDTYAHMNKIGILDDIPKVPWDQGVHPHLHFISHLPSTVMGEQLLSQFLRTMPDHEWLFQYGRVPLSLILNDHIYKRVVSTVDDTMTRCKVSLIAEAVASCTPALPFDAHQPFNEHFHPSAAAYAKPAEAKKSSRAIGKPFQSMNIIPLEDQYIQRGTINAWDFCLRRLFVKKATPLKDVLPTLAPGAQSLLKTLTDPKLPDSERIDVSKPVIKLTAPEWAIFIKVFSEWPFKPDELDIGETFSDRKNK